jgi:16S rRNA (cytidine1402-2'-O)-methyltransferase
MSHQHRNSLYVVATPIGNLKDITLRALEVLSDVDVIVSEHVGKTRNLLRHFGIKTKVLSYREENALRVIPRVLDALEAGRSVALVAEAGTPGVSDPGRRLVDAARSAGFRAVPVPGASAVVAAVSVAGMDDGRFVFEGFLPRRSGRRKKRLKELAPDARPLVLFESPHRLVDCLKDMLAAFGDRRCLIAREISKMHEEIVTGRLSDFITRFTASKPLGEFVLVCQGSTEVPPAKAAGRAVIEEVEALVVEGIKKTKAVRTIAKKYGLRGSEIYEMITADSKKHPKGGS